MINIEAFGTGFGLVLLGLVLGISINIAISVIKQMGKL